MNVILKIILLILILNILLSLNIIFFERKRPEKTIAWVAIVLILPIFGIIAYIVLGRNWRMPKSYNSDLDFSKYMNFPDPKLQSLVEYESIIKLLKSNSNCPVFINNSIEIFHDTTAFFYTLKEEISKAKHHIHLEYYTVRSDELGDDIKDILIERARAGIQVRFIIDCSGSPSLEKTYIKDLKDAGVDVILYCCLKKVLARTITTHAIYRDHRKLTIIDGKVAFIGGNNIGNEYVGKSKYGFWRDTHLMVHGDFIYGIQSVFLNNFAMLKKADKTPFKIDKNLDIYFPSLNIVGSKKMQLFRSGPDTQHHSALQSMLSLISMATDHIYITVPYFAPPQHIKEALKMAVLRGVDVHILFPDKMDHAFMHHASKSHLYELVEHGVTVHLYDRNCFVHAKIVMIDGRLCSVGSTNMDYYSLVYNYEINAVIYEGDITLELEHQFNTDIKKSSLMTTNYYNEIPMHTKLFQNIARVLTGIL